MVGSRRGRKEGGRREEHWEEKEGQEKKEKKRGEERERERRRKEEEKRKKRRNDSRRRIRRRMNVLNRLDNANSLLININVSDIDRLQRIQIRAARIVSNERKYDHVSPLFKQLHWLPVHKRIMYKVALFVYKSMHNLIPSYISIVCFVPSSNQDIRYVPSQTPFFCKSPASILFLVPCTIWNSLPLSIRSCSSVASQNLFVFFVIVF